MFSFVLRFNRGVIVLVLIINGYTWYFIVCFKWPQQIIGIFIIFTIKSKCIDLVINANPLPPLIGSVPIV